MDVLSSIVVIFAYIDMFPIAKIQLLFGFSKQFVEFWHAEHLHIRQGKRICHAELTQIFPFSKVHMGTYPVCTQRYYFILNVANKSRFLFLCVVVTEDLGKFLFGSG